MEADAEAAFPAPPDDVASAQRESEAVTSSQHRRRRPIRADHVANVDAMYNHVNEDASHFPRTRATGRDNTANSFHEISAPTSRQRPSHATTDSNPLQQQSQQQFSGSNSNLNSAFLKHRARFNSNNSNSNSSNGFLVNGQDDDAKMQAFHSVSSTRPTRSRSQPAVHHLNQLGELQSVGGSSRQLHSGNQQRGGLEVRRTTGTNWCFELNNLHFLHIFLNQTVFESSRRNFASHDRV